MPNWLEQIVWVETKMSKQMALHFSPSFDPSVQFSLPLMQEGVVFGLCLGPTP